MTVKTDKSAVTPEVKAETPKVVIKEAPVEEGPKLSAQTLAEQEAGRAALKAHQAAIRGPQAE